MASIPDLQRSLNIHRSLSSKIQAEVHVARRTAQALRAIQVLTYTDRIADGDEVQDLRRDDLAQLIEIIQSDLSDRLDALEMYVEQLPPQADRA